jgi:PadR family transcriptional regulator, regulatory protein PadR
MYLKPMPSERKNQRELLKGTLGPIILRLLKEHKRMYGYEITRCVKEMSDGRLLIREGSLYPTLHKLEADGHIQAEEVHLGKRVRRYYKLTKAGTAEAKAASDELLDFLRMVHDLMTTRPIPRDAQPG